MDIPSAEEIADVSIYPMLESMGFGTVIYDGVIEMMAANL